LLLVAIFIYEHCFTISCDDLMTKLRRIYDEVMTILWSTNDFSKIGPLDSRFTLSTVLVTRSISQLVRRTNSALGLNSPGFRFLVMSYVFSLRVTISVLVFYEPCLSYMPNVRALSVTVYSRTVIAEHCMRSEKGHPILMSIVGWQ